MNLKELPDGTVLRVRDSKSIAIVTGIRGGKALVWLNDFGMSTPDWSGELPKNTKIENLGVHRELFALIVKAFQEMDCA